MTRAGFGLGIFQKAEDRRDLILEFKQIGPNLSTLVIGVKIAAIEDLSEFSNPDPTDDQ